MKEADWKSYYDKPAWILTAENEALNVLNNSAVVTRKLYEVRTVLLFSHNMRSDVMV